MIQKKKIINNNLIKYSNKKMIANLEKKFLNRQIPSFIEKVIVLFKTLWKGNKITLEKIKFSTLIIL